jgi:hypothetical protein
MRTAIIAAAALVLVGCDESIRPCVAASEIAIAVQGRSFVFPVALRPGVLGAPKGSRLPSYYHRDELGRWAYCQRPTDPPTKITSIVFNPPDDGTTQARFIIVGETTPLADRTYSARFPPSIEQGYEVLRTKGSIDIFSPAGGVRAKPVSAFCMTEKDGALSGCRISFVANDGVAVTFDLRDAHPLKAWAVIISDVDAYVTKFELRRGWS